MPIQVTEVDGILWVIVTGVWPTVDEISDARDQAIKSGQLTDTTLELVDVRAMIGRAPTMSDARLLARRFTHPPARRAFLVNRDAHYGVGRMAEVLLPSNPRVFRSEVEAIAWLKDPGEPVV